MGPDSSAIDTAVIADPPESNRRVRKVNWIKVLEIVDQSPGKWHLIGEFDQSVRTHIKQGRYSYIDPAKYDACTGKIDGKGRQRANLFLMRRA